MTLESLEVRAVEPCEGWPYEWVTAIARFAIDPTAPGNDRITDLDRVHRDADGRVRFEADVRIMRPTGAGLDNGRTLVVIPNRGMTHGVPFSLDAPAMWEPDAHHAGDGFLLERGWTIAWCGWQWDVLAGGLGLRAPIADVDPGWMRVEFRPDVVEADHALGDSSMLFRFATNPTADIDDPDAVLTVRTAPLGAKTVVPRNRWRFLKGAQGDRFELDGGFQPFHYYELVYRCAVAPVAGCGLLAVRDFGAHLRQSCEHLLTYGVSQSGRFLRQFLFDGLNVDEEGHRVFDAVFAHIASARRGEFNMRYAQPSLTHPLTPGYGPPYDSAGLLARQRAVGGMPKVFLSNSASEYWRGDGALVHQDPHTGDDLPDDPDTRVFLLSGTDHMGTAPFKSSLPVANPVHTLDVTPIMRALFVALEQWACDGVEPPESQIPRRRDATLVEREKVLARFAIPVGIAGGAGGAGALPDVAALPYTPAIDPESTSWPLVLGDAMVALVSDVDDDGNEIAGIRLPTVSTPVSAYTGWNPRTLTPGLPDVLYEFVGSRLPRRSTRPLPDRATYEAAARSAARALVEGRFLLERDIERTVAEALRSYDSGA